MKYYLSEIIPRLKKYSTTLDQLVFLVDKPWVVSNSEESFEKLIFRSDGRVHLSRDGEVTDGKWEYLPEAQSLLIDYGDRKRLYRHQYLDEAVLALKIDGKVKSNEKYYLLADERRVKDCDAEKYLKHKYLAEKNIEVKLLDNGKELEIMKDMDKARVNNPAKINGLNAPDGVYYTNEGNQKIFVQNGVVQSIKNKISYNTNLLIWQHDQNQIPIKGDEVEGGFQGVVRVEINKRSYKISVKNGIVQKVILKTDEIVLWVGIITILLLITFFLYSLN